VEGKNKYRLSASKFEFLEGLYGDATEIGAGGREPELIWLRIWIMYEVL
jgi:hypothetical protein